MGSAHTYCRGIIDFLEIRHKARFATHHSLPAGSDLPLKPQSFASSFPCNLSLHFIYEIAHNFPFLYFPMNNITRCENSQCALLIFTLKFPNHTKRIVNTAIWYPAPLVQHRKVHHAMHQSSLTSSLSQHVPQLSWGQELVPLMGPFRKQPQHQLLPATSSW